MRNAHFGFGYFPSKRDNEMVINWCKDHDEEYRKNGKGSWWDFQGTKLGVHGSSLLDRKCRELSQAAVEHDGASKNGENFYHNFDFFYLLHCAF